MNNFHEQVENYLHDKSASELRTIIVKLASKLSNQEQENFLATLASKQIVVKKDNRIYDQSTVLDNIRGMLETIERYSIEAYYYDNWDDDGYTIDDDDGFCNDFEKCYIQAIGLLEQGLYSEAAEAIDLLFAIIQRFDDFFDNEGLCFDMFIDEGELNVDIRKLWILNGYSNLMSQSDSDILETLGRIFYRKNHHGDAITFEEVLHAGSEPVPDFEKALGLWLSVLEKFPPRETSAYYKEAAILARNIDIMKTFATTTGVAEPSAYIDLCTLYMEQGHVSDNEIISLAVAGLNNTTTSSYRRTQLASFLAGRAYAANDNEVYTFALAEKFYSSMRAGDFIPIYKMGDADVIQNVTNKMDSMTRSSNRDVDYYIVHFLNKNYDMVFDAVKSDKKTLGWSGSTKGAILPYFIGLLAGFNENARMIPNMLKHGFTDSEAADMYSLLRNNVESVDFAQADVWHEWCVSEVGKRTDALVSGQHRGSYFKAAYLLVAICEVMINKGELNPYEIIHTYKAKYPRHSAFASELRTALVDIAKIKHVKI